MIKSSMPYKEGDLLPVGMLAISPSIIVASANSKINSIKDIVELAKILRVSTFLLRVQEVRLTLWLR